MSVVLVFSWLQFLLHFPTITLKQEQQKQQEQITLNLWLWYCLGGWFCHIALWTGGSSSSSWAKVLGREYTWQNIYLELNLKRRGPKENGNIKTVFSRSVKKNFTAHLYNATFSARPWETTFSSRRKRVRRERLSFAARLWETNFCRSSMRG